MSKYLVDDTSIISNADAIRIKTGTSSTMVFPNEFVSAIENISNNGTNGQDDFITRNFSEYTNNTASYIASDAFYSFPNLKTVSFTACETINQNAFARCFNLSSINFPICTNIGPSAF